MQFALVVGTVVATQKEAKIGGRKLLVIQPVDINLKSVGTQLVAIDAVGAGFGELIIYATGSSARQTAWTEGTPCDCVIMGIVDNVEYRGQTIFDKAQALDSPRAV